MICPILSAEAEVSAIQVDELEQLCINVKILNKEN